MTTLKEHVAKSLQEVRAALTDASPVPASMSAFDDLTPVWVSRVGSDSKVGDVTLAWIGLTSESDVVTISTGPDLVISGPISSMRVTPVGTVRRRQTLMEIELGSDALRMDFVPPWGYVTPAGEHIVTVLDRLAPQATLIGRGLSMRGLFGAGAPGTLMQRSSSLIHSDQPQANASRWLNRFAVSRAPLDSWFLHAP